MRRTALLLIASVAALAIPASAVAPGAGAAERSGRVQRMAGEVLDPHGRHEIPLLRNGDGNARHPDSRLRRHGRSTGWPTASAPASRRPTACSRSTCAATARRSVPTASASSGRRTWISTCSRSWTRLGIQKAHIGGFSMGGVDHEPAHGARAGALQQRALRRIGRARGTGQRVREDDPARPAGHGAARRGSAQAVPGASGRRGGEGRRANAEPTSRSSRRSRCRRPCRGRRSI